MLAPRIQISNSKYNGTEGKPTAKTSAFLPQATATFTTSTANKDYANWTKQKFGSVIEGEVDEKGNRMDTSEVCQSPGLPSGISGQV